MRIAVSPDAGRQDAQTSRVPEITAPPAPLSSSPARASTTSTSVRPRSSRRCAARPGGGRRRRPPAGRTPPRHPAWCRSSRPRHLAVRTFHGFVVEPYAGGGPRREQGRCASVAVRGLPGPWRPAHGSGSGRARSVERCGRQSAAMLHTSRRPARRPGHPKHVRRRRAGPAGGDGRAGAPASTRPGRDARPRPDRRCRHYAPIPTPAPTRSRCPPGARRHRRR